MMVAPFCFAAASETDASGSRHSTRGQKEWHNPVGVETTYGGLTQGSSFLATLGWRAESHLGFHDGCAILFRRRQRNRRVGIAPFNTRPKGMAQSRRG